MKHNILIYMVINIFFAGCASGVSSSGASLNIGLGSMMGSHVGVGTSVRIPLGYHSHDTKVQSDMRNNYVLKEQIVTYFSARGMVTDAAVKGGFYRKLLSKLNSDEYLVQDFYEMGGMKRTDPMILSREQLMTFHTNPHNGTLTVYTIDGEIIKNQVFKNNQLVK